MNHLHINNLRLTTRNEGKIKSYYSCTDVRAWSHDFGVRDRYLREWMKADMPVYFIPYSNLTGYLSKMTCKSRRWATPRCHPDCKSKMVLDSIYNSCQAVKKCLQRDGGLEKYFIEEELESSQWPCEKYLEALKCIKMFWKILLNKIFGINLSICEAYETNCGYPVSVRSIVGLWESDILQQTHLVQNSPSICKSLDESTVTNLPEIKMQEPYCIGDSICNCNPHKYKTPYCTKKYSRCTSIKVRAIDCACNTTCIEDKICTYKEKIEKLQAKYDSLNKDFKRLKDENCILRKEVKNVQHGCPWKASFFLPEDKCICQSVKIIPKPLKSNLKDNCCPVDNIDSEMIITMKNGKNESYRYVSILQVLHKTNFPIIKDLIVDCKPCCRKEDPIEILNKVHNAVGAIVKREMCLADDRRGNCQPKTEVDATFHTLHGSKSTLSCSSILSELSLDSEPICAKLNDCHGSCIKITNI